MTTEWTPGPPPGELIRWSTDSLLDYGYANEEAQALASHLPRTYPRDLELNKSDGRGPYAQLAPPAAVLGVISTRLLSRGDVQRLADSGRDLLALVAIVEAFAYCPNHPTPDTGDDPHILERLPLRHEWVEDDRRTDRQLATLLFAGARREEVDAMHSWSASDPPHGQVEFLAAMRCPDFEVWIDRCFELPRALPDHQFPRRNES